MIRFLLALAVTTAITATAFLIATYIDFIKTHLESEAVQFLAIFGPTFLILLAGAYAVIGRENETPRKRTNARRLYDHPTNTPEGQRERRDGAPYRSPFISADDMDREYENLKRGLERCL